MSVISVSSCLKRRQIWSSLVILVPYERHHVPKYNGWMQNAQLQYLTGSEPLTLEDEYQMYESWTSDPSKCTFIVLDASIYASLSGEEDHSKREIESMVGDVNFYITDATRAVAEIEIMIAEVSARGKGLGGQAAKLMMKFAYQLVGILIFEAKIKTTNVVSQRLFQKSFGFVETSRSEVFEEITYQCDLTLEDTVLKQIFDQTPIDYKLI